MPNIIKEFYQKKSILGVCLGHQAIGEFFGFSLKQLDIPFHGLSTENIVLDVHSKLFLGLPNNFKVGRYHSWVIEGAVEEINISSVDENKNIMSIAHKQYPIFGVQFHPESILSEHGQKIILNFLNN
jgi:anthranilate synthase component 2